MKKIERYNLIGSIASELQRRMNTTGINVFLAGFGIPHKGEKIVPSKRVYVEDLLAPVSETTIVQIARELDIPLPSSASRAGEALGEYLTASGYHAAVHDFERALSYVGTDAEQALGSASSTLESICKALLHDFDVPVPKDQSLQPLLKAVFDEMDLSPEGHADPDIKRVLGGLLNAAIGIGVLRTKYSGFHGKTNQQKRKRLSERHARLAVNSCTTIGLFLVETYRERFAGKPRH